MGDGEAAAKPGRMGHVLASLVILIAAHVVAVSFAASPERPMMQWGVLAFASIVSGALVAWPGTASAAFGAVAFTVAVAVLAAIPLAALAWTDGGELNQAQTMFLATISAGGLALVGGLVGAVGAGTAARLRRVPATRVR